MSRRSMAAARAKPRRCLLCGSTKEVQWHHLGGRRHVRFGTVPLCRRCHVVLTRALYQAQGDMMSYTSDPNERLQRIVRAVSVFLWQAAEELDPDQRSVSSRAHDVPKETTGRGAGPWAEVAGSCPRLRLRDSNGYRAAIDVGRLQAVSPSRGCIRDGSEGLFYGDDVTAHERDVLDAYVRSPDHHPNVTVKTFPPKLRLPLYSRAAFIEQVFWKAIQRGALVVGFNLKFDLSRLAVQWRAADDGGFSLVFSERRSRKTGQIAWVNAEAVNIYDGTHCRLAQKQTAAHDRVIPQTFGSALRQYPRHVESKSLAPDGTPCTAETRGVLQRAHVTAGRLRFVGKETDRHWDHGDDLSLLQFKVMEYQPTAKMVVADAKIRAQVAVCGRRELMRMTGVSQHTIEKILRGVPVRQATLQRVFATMNR
jgi:hypothetical protein